LVCPKKEDEGGESAACSYRIKWNTVPREGKRRGFILREGREREEKRGGKERRGLPSSTAV